MRMPYHKPPHIAAITAESGVYKTSLGWARSSALGVMAGAFIALGFLLHIRIAAVFPDAWSGVGSLVGAAVFPLGLILTLLAGGELLTGNMMAVPVARLAGKISTRQLLVNWACVTAGNFLGAMLVAYLFGHVAGLTAAEPYMSQTVAIAQHKLEDTFLQAFVSGIGCNWLVALAVWLAYGADDIAGKIAGIWFPTMAFVAIGFQHVVANMFVIPAAIFEGYATWGDYVRNFIPVYLGNAVGGSLFVGTVYWFVYLRKPGARSAAPGRRSA